MVFSKNITEEKKEAFAKWIKVSVTNNINNYLGMPTQLGWSKSQSFKFLVDRIRHKINNWKSKRLSWAGCITMIRVVLQAAPTYIKSTFLIPKTIYNQVE